MPHGSGWYTINNLKKTTITKPMLECKYSASNTLDKDANVVCGGNSFAAKWTNGKFEDD